MQLFLKIILPAVGIALAGILSIGPGLIDRHRNAVSGEPPFVVSQQAQALHDDLIIGDWHADTLLWQRSLLRRANRGHVDLPRLIDGNVALQMFTAVTQSPAGHGTHTDTFSPLAVAQLWPPRTWDSPLERARYQAKRLHSYAAASNGQLRVIRSRADLDALLADRAAGQVVVGGLLGVEGGHALEGEIGNLEELRNAGHRMIGLQHFFDNGLGGSLHGQTGQGLTVFGRLVVAETERQGLILDLAHAAPQVVRDVIAMTDMPLVVSHTGIFSHCPVKRNFPDELMQEIAATGGVIAIGYWNTVTCDESPAGVAAAIKAAVTLLGDDHVALGSDFDGAVTTGFDTSQLAALTHALIAAGLTKDQIAKVMGGNMIRVLRARLR